MTGGPTEARARIAALEADNAALRAALDAAYWYRISDEQGRVWVLCRGCSIPQGGWPDPQSGECEHMHHCWVARLLAASPPEERAAPGVHVYPAGGGASAAPEA